MRRRLQHVDIVILVGIVDIFRGLNLAVAFRFGRSLGSGFLGDPSSEGAVGGLGLGLGLGEILVRGPSLLQVRSCLLYTSPSPRD